MFVNPKSLLGSKMVNDTYGITGRDIKLGADIFVKASLSDKLKDLHGLYFCNDIANFAQPHPDALNEVKITQVVDIISKVIKNIYLFILIALNDSSFKYH